MPPARKSRKLSDPQPDQSSDQRKTRSNAGSSSSSAVSKQKEVKIDKNETVATKSPKAFKVASKSPGVEQGDPASRSSGEQAVQTPQSPSRGSARISSRVDKQVSKVSAGKTDPKIANVVQRASPRSARLSAESVSSTTGKSPAQSARKASRLPSETDVSTTKDETNKSSTSGLSTPRPRGRPRKTQTVKSVDSTADVNDNKTSRVEEQNEEASTKDVSGGKEEVNNSKQIQSINGEKGPLSLEPITDAQEKEVTTSVDDIEMKSTDNTDSQKGNSNKPQNKGSSIAEDISKPNMATAGTQTTIISKKKRPYKADQQEPQPSAKKPKADVEVRVTVQEETSLTSPRKSGRQRKLSSWLEGMEVGFGKKKPSEGGKGKKKTTQRTIPTSTKTKSVLPAEVKQVTSSAQEAVEQVTVTEVRISPDVPKASTVEPLQEAPSEEISQVTPGEETPQEPPGEEMPQEPPREETPQDPSGEETPQDPSVEEMPQEPPREDTPQETPAERPPLDGPPSQTPEAEATEEGTQADIVTREELCETSDPPEGEGGNVDTAAEEVSSDKYIIPLVMTQPLCEPTDSDVTVQRGRPRLPSVENTDAAHTIVISEPRPEEPIPDTYRSLTYTSVVMPAEQAASTDSLLKTMSVETQAGGEDSKADQKKQEFVIVRLPVGVAIQQETVTARKPVEEDDIVRCQVDEVEGTFKCLDCNYVTTKKPNWYKHKRKHMGVKPYTCDVCQYRSSTSSNLKRHMGIHKDIRTHACDRCGLTFRQKIHLERHIKYKHEEKSVQCPLCDYVCANENPDLKIHIKRRHERPKEMSPDGGYTCDECGLVAITRRDYRQHMKFHRKGPELKLFCEHCSFVTDCESRMNRHVMIHTKVKPFQCGLCDYKGTQKEHLMRHMKSQHQMDLPEKGLTRMQQRDKQGTTDPALVALGISEDSLSNPPTPSPSEQDKKYDRADFSSRDKIFACNHCTMKFSKLINLYKHLHSQHRSIMPSSVEEFSCVVCEFHTNSKKNLLVHMRKHNLLDQSPPTHVYSCVLCSYVNPKRRNLFQHMKKKHKIEIVMKDDGSANCFIAENSNLAGGSGEGGNENLMTVGDVVTASTSDTHLQVVTESGVSGSVQRLVSISDLTNAIALPQNTDGVVYIDHGADSKAVTQMDLADLQVESINVQHEAAEAIQGLQALAEQSQRHVLEAPISVSIDQFPSSVTETQVELGEQVELTEQVLTEQVEEVSPQVLEVNPPISVVGSEVAAVETEDGMSSSGEDRGSSIQLSSDQLMNLSSGDYVEINGEMYKVEFTTEDGS